LAQLSGRALKGEKKILKEGKRCGTSGRRKKMHSQRVHNTTHKLHSAEKKFKKLPGGEQLGS